MHRPFERTMLRWLIDIDVEPTGSGPHGPAGYREQIRTDRDGAWRRTSTCSTTPTCVADRDGEMRRASKNASPPRGP